MHIRQGEYVRTRAANEYHYRGHMAGIPRLHVAVRRAKGTL